MAKNIKSTSGKNPNTPPTPPISPSTTKDCVKPSGMTRPASSPAFSKKASNHPTTGPEKVKVNLKMEYITTAKIGRPKNRFNTTLSILSERSCLSSGEWLCACVQTPLINPYLLSAMMTSGSSEKCCFRWFLLFSFCKRISWPPGNCVINFIIQGSFSKSLTLSHPGGYPPGKPVSFLRKFEIFSISNLT